MKKQLNCILLIDDDEPTNFLNKLTVEQADCARHVQVVQSGHEGLQYLTRSGEFEQPQDTLPHPDLIFLDINMPAMDGWEFLEQYKQLPQEQKAKIIVIMLTTSLNPDDEERTRAIPEVAGFENKPLHLDRLEDILARHFPQLH